MHISPPPIFSRCFVGKLRTLPREPICDQNLLDWWNSRPTIDVLVWDGQDDRADSTRWSCELPIR